MIICTVSARSGYNMLQQGYDVGVQLRNMITQNNHMII